MCFDCPYLWFECYVNSIGVKDVPWGRPTKAGCGPAFGFIVAATARYDPQRGETSSQQREGADIERGVEPSEGQSGSPLRPLCWPLPRLGVHAYHLTPEL